MPLIFDFEMLIHPTPVQPGAVSYQYFMKSNHKTF